MSTEAEAQQKEAEKRLPENIIKRAYKVFGSGLGAGTKFGKNSGILLHMLARFWPRIPLIHADSGDLSPEDIAYRHSLVSGLDLRVHTCGIFESLSPHEKLLLQGSEEDKQRFYLRRKVEPFHQALGEFGIRAVLSGVRASQNQKRGRFRVCERDSRGILFIYPLLRMSDADALAYLKEWGIPLHPDGPPGGSLFECGLHKRSATT